MSLATKSRFWSDAVPDPEPPARAPLQKALVLSPGRTQPLREARRLTAWPGFHHPALLTGPGEENQDPKNKIQTSPQLSALVSKRERESWLWQVQSSRSALRPGFLFYLHSPHLAKAAEDHEEDAGGGTSQPWPAEQPGWGRRGPRRGLTCTQPRPDARPPGGGAASKGESEKTTARPRAGPSLLRVPFPGGFPAQEGAGVFHRLSSGRRLKITREGVGDLLQRPRF